MYVFTQKASLAPTLTLALTAEERTRSRYRYTIPREITGNGGGKVVSASGSATGLAADNLVTQPPWDLYLQMPRGTTFQDGDCLAGEDHDEILKIVAQPEPVLTVRTAGAARLLRAAYHLGNRHVPLEVGADYLRLSPDPVLESMLAQLGVSVSAETAPFHPESGAYGHHH